MILEFNRACFQSINLNLSHLKETPSDTDPKKKKKKRDDDPDRKKKKKDKKKKKVRQSIKYVVFEPDVVPCRDKRPSKNFVYLKTSKQHFIKI